MKRFNDDRIGIMLVGFVAAIVLGGGNVKADFALGTPTNLGLVINSGTHDDTPFISADGLSLYFLSLRQGGDHGGGDIWVSTRETTDSEWGPPENMGPTINTPAQEFHPSISTDGLEFYFARWEEASGDSAIWVSTRATVDDPWTDPVKLDLTDESTDEWDPSLTADGLQLYFGYNVPGDEALELRELCVTTRQTKNSPWGPAVRLGPAVNGWGYQVDPRIAADGRLLLFADYWNAPNRPDGFGQEDMWFAKRIASGADWSEPVNLGSSVNTVFADVAGTISVDGSTLYFTSDRCGGAGRLDIWQAPIFPVVDFDDDGTVGTSDVLAVIDRWGTDDHLCDIGPMPWGDGVVDEADLEVLMGYWGQDVAAGKPELVAQWTFDEAEGTIAHDSAGTYDGNLVGDPVWRPDGGVVGGALEFDGIDDHVDIENTMDPDYPFSMFAWVKGGGINQAIISESDQYGYPFLIADHISGNLMTMYMHYPDNALYSETNIIDGQWHHVGLVWDGWSLARILYVDGVEVARSAEEKCLNWKSWTNLRIGASWETTWTGLWSGLIDDVRIYRGALSPEDVATLAQ